MLMNRDNRFKIIINQIQETWINKKFKFNKVIHFSNIYGQWKLHNVIFIMQFDSILFSVKTEC